MAAPAAETEPAGWAAEPGRYEAEDETAASRSPSPRPRERRPERRRAPRVAAPADDTGDETLDETAATAAPPRSPFRRPGASGPPMPRARRRPEPTAGRRRSPTRSLRTPDARPCCSSAPWRHRRPSRSPRRSRPPGRDPRRRPTGTPPSRSRGRARWASRRPRRPTRAPAQRHRRGPAADGVQGPGWAFATTRVPVSPDDETLHEEARRLARLLVSEIKLYNEEQVDEGRRNRDLYERLKEDIDRSRQMYEERVEPRVLKSTDYFYQELVRILAAGDARALGI